jgi:hypothetical protein
MSESFRFGDPLLSRAATCLLTAEIAVSRVISAMYITIVGAMSTRSTGCFSAWIFTTAGRGYLIINPIGLLPAVSRIADCGAIRDALPWRCRVLGGKSFAVKRRDWQRKLPSYDRNETENDCADMQKLHLVVSFLRGARICSNFPYRLKQGLPGKQQKAVPLASWPHC